MYHPIAETLNDFNARILIAAAVYRGVSLILAVSWLKVKSGGNKVLIMSNRTVRIN